LTINDIDVEATIRKVQALLAQEQNISAALRSTLDILLLVVQLLADRLGLNSRNSSKPPSSDRNRSRDKSSKVSTRKAGGQPGSIGTTLRQVEEPDEIEVLTVDRTTLPLGQYREIGFERRQVFDIDIRRLITELNFRHPAPNLASPERWHNWE
jgi:transposase